MTYGLRFLPIFALVAAMFSFGVGTPFGPDAAWAQTATNLDCKKCVRGKAIKKGAVKFNRLQGKVQDRITGLESARTALEAAAAERVPFYVTLDGNGSEQTIATNGPLEYFVRCTVNDGGNDIVEIIATSSQNGWFSSDQTGAPLNAGDEVDQHVLQRNDLTTPFYDEEIDEGSIVFPDGSYMGIDGEMTGLGLNLFGHDCLAVGNVFLITGTP